MDLIMIKLSATWVALMLTYLLGDVLRLASGDWSDGKMGGMTMSKNMFLGVSIMMFIPIVMVLVSLYTHGNILKWSNLIAAGFFFLLNIIGLPTYKSRYDQFLIAMSLFINVLTVITALKI